MKQFTVAGSQFTVENTRSFFTENEPTFKGRLGKNNTKMKIHLENAPRIAHFIETVNRKP